MRERFIQLSAIGQEHPQIGMSNVVVLSDGERLRPKRFAISPVGSLFPGARSQSRNDDNSGSGQNFPVKSQRNREISDEPGDGDV